MPKETEKRSNLPEVTQQSVHPSIGPVLSLPHLTGLSTLPGASWLLFCFPGPESCSVGFAVCSEPVRRPHWLPAVRDCVEQREVAAEGGSSRGDPRLLPLPAPSAPHASHLVVSAASHLQPSARLPGGSKKPWDVTQNPPKIYCPLPT